MVQLQVLARFFAARLSELCEMSGADLISSLQAAEAETAEASSAPDEMEANQPARPPAGTLTNLPPADIIPLPHDWLKGIYDVVDALAALQLPAQVLAVLSAAVRRDVHDAISALGKDWLFVPVLAAVEQYVAAAPLLLLRHLLPRMVRLLSTSGGVMTASNTWIQQILAQCSTSWHCLCCRVTNMALYHRTIPLKRRLHSLEFSRCTWCAGS